jgi:aminoglycoside phosphotransferase (APT) family kinase protein
VQNRQPTMKIVPESVCLHFVTICPGGYLIQRRPLMSAPPTIDLAVARTLIDAQFPEWSNLPLRQVLPGGWDNRTFRLGEQLAVRIPSSGDYATQPEKEHRWLPLFAPKLSVSIPLPVALGSASTLVPWPWTVCRWLQGTPASDLQGELLQNLPAQLAAFLRELQAIDTSGGPVAGAHSFFRGGHPGIYDNQARSAIAALADRLDAETALRIWETGIATSWDHAPVWVHGDVAAGNLLMHEGALRAVIDFGCLAIGDPACDLAIAWTLFDPPSREIFRRELPLDDASWERGRAWTLWKAAIVAAGKIQTNEIEAAGAWHTLRAVCEP